MQYNFESFTQNCNSAYMKKMYNSYPLKDKIKTKLRVSFLLELIRMR